MIASTIFENHPLLSDWMLLLAAIVFVVATVAAYVRLTPPRDLVVVLVPLGLALFAIGMLVL